jgi:hypothetical protein
MIGGVGVEKLVGDVDEYGRAARRDASLGYEEKKPRQKLLHLDGGGKLRRLAEEFDREILGVILRLQPGRDDGGVHGMPEAEARVSLRAGKLATLAIGITIGAARSVGLRSDCHGIGGRG